MNTLITRKIVFGILMSLVLAFSVQGTADAITKFTRGSGDLQLYAPGKDFKINFSVSLQGRVDDGDGNDTYHYDDESINIAVTNANIRKVGSYDITTRASTHSMNEQGTNATKLSSNVSLTLRADSPGTVTITITDTRNDYPSGVDAPPNVSDLVFTVYIAPEHYDATTLESPTNAVDFSIGEKQINETLTADLSNVRVNYTVSGSGSLLLRTDDNERNGGRNLTTSSAADVYLNMGGSTNKVTASIVGQRADSAVSVTYIYGTATLTKHSGDNQKGASSSRLANPLVVKVVDGKNRPVSGVQIDFTPNESFSRDPSFPSDLYVADNMVKTNRSGLANVFWVLGQRGTADTPPPQTATAQLADIESEIQANRPVFTATFGTATSTASSIAIESGDGQRADEFNIIEDPLVVTVRDQRGQLMVNASVEFLARDGGELNSPETDDPGSEAAEVETYRGTSSRRVVMTDASGQASVRYSPPEGSGKRTVSAGILGTAKSQTFTINGAPSSGGSGDPDPDPPPVATRGSLNISLSGSGNTRTVTVTALNPGGTAASGISVLLNVNNGATLSRTSGPSPLTSTLTLPGTAGDYILSATTTADYTGDSETITITSPGTLSLQEVGARAANGGQSIRVTVREADGTLASGTVRVTLSGAASRIVDATNGTGAASLTLPTTGGPHTVTLSATGYTTSQHTFSTAGQQTGDPSQPTTGPTGAADSIEIDGSRQLSRNVNQATPLRVRVVDVNNRGVSDVRVTFRVLAPGQGRLSQRGNGRAVQVNTDRNGYASASLTPLGGDVIVEAKAAGVSASVTFIIDVSGATTPTPTPTPTPSTDAPSSQMINPEDAEVHVGAAQRSPMLWVDGGAIYALVDADVQRFAPSVENALHITVGGNKVYWTAQTGTSSGTINSANLDGSGVTELKSIMAVPMGIAVDTDARKLYWTNSRGRIQSANLNGSSVTNVLENLEGATDIAVARGLVYWTQFDATTGQGRLGIMNPNAGQNGTRYISTGSDSPMSLTINGNKVYWTEQTGVSSGTINSANLNGSGVKQLASIRAVPSGMGVDMARSHLYWTNSRGRIQRADLDGKQIQNVADGLGSPGDMVLSNSIPTPTAVTSTTPTPTPTADNAQYDVNGDGLVNNTDASLVAGAMNTSNTKYDVNGDGTVNFLDLLLVFDNRDAGAASAPTVVGMQLSAVQVDVLQEQIDLLIATNDRSPAAMRTLIYLQQLIATARPEKTQLLANYPNPFNPETWIPYELATDTNVRLTIYNTHGVVIRTLQLGHQSAGYYVGRDRAAYWDGRNALGEQVASGIYFYQFETDTMSSMRKMVILK